MYSTQICSLSWMSILRGEGVKTLRGAFYFVCASSEISLSFSKYSKKIQGVGCKTVHKLSTPLTKIQWVGSKTVKKLSTPSLKSRGWVLKLLKNYLPPSLKSSGWVLKLLKNYLPPSLKSLSTCLGIQL